MNDMTVKMIALRTAAQKFIAAFDDPEADDVAAFTDLLDAASAAGTEWGKPFTEDTRPGWTRG